MRLGKKRRGQGRSRSGGLTGGATPAAATSAIATAAISAPATAVVVAPEVAASEAGAASTALGLPVRGGAGGDAGQPAWHLLVGFLLTPTPVSAARLQTSWQAFVCWHGSESDAGRGAGLDDKSHIVSPLFPHKGQRSYLLMAPHCNDMEARQ